MKLRELRLTGGCLVIAATLAGAAATAAAAPSGPPALTPADVIARTLAHSPVLQGADEAARAAGWRHEQADAQSRLAFDVRAGASHYTGLDDAQLGPSLVIPEIQDRYQASVGATLPLLTGGRSLALRRGAAWAEQAARQTRAATRDDLVLQATLAYWAWARSHHQAEALEAAVTRMEALAADMTAMRTAGLATENDRLATEVQLEQTRLRRDDCRRQTEQALAMLAYLTGAAFPADSRPLRPDLDASPDLLDGLPAPAQAVTNRADLAAARAQAQAARQEVRVAQAGHRPQVSLTARYEQARPNALDFPPEDRWQDDAFVGATLSWALWDGGLSRAKVGEARARAAQAVLAARQAGEQAAWQVKVARIALAGALDRVATCRLAETAADLNAGTAADLWKSGLARHSDVLDAEARLADSQFQTVAARCDVHAACARLRQALGLH